jgi:pimeloyl-ACP methyl ester carboxylesterase
MGPQPPSSTPGTLHHVHPVSAFEVATPSRTNNQPPTNLLLWIGGLTDTYHSVAYVYALAASLPPTWSLAQANLSSAGSGFGIASLSQDVAELSSLIHYFKSGKKNRVVIMGHSTGCQDCLHYFASSGDRATVDGVILQAPVSDREAMVKDMAAESYHLACQTAQRYCQEGKGEYILPLNLTTSMFGNIPISARRWVALACKGGEDDYFSSDLSEERLKSTLAKVDKPLLIVYGEKDEYVPESVDKKALVARWMGVVGEKAHGKSSDLLDGASHNLNGDDERVVGELITRVNDFLTSL